MTSKTPKQLMALLKDKHFLLFALAMLFMILPGIPAFYLFHREEFMTIDWIKLSLLSAALELPMVFLGIFIMPIFFDNQTEKSKKDDFFFEVAFSALKNFSASKKFTVLPPSAWQPWRFSPPSNRL
ncbi:hypothetical protein JW899_05150 [Candidatus Uhrbacteria bacterium]|nr:hypothetical protein [Candidatus Uhrbacteria bacterium]